MAQWGVDVGYQFCFDNLIGDVPSAPDLRVEISEKRHKFWDPQKSNDINATGLGEMCRLGKNSSEYSRPWVLWFRCLIHALNMLTSEMKMEIWERGSLTYSL